MKGSEKHSASNASVDPRKEKKKKQKKQKNKKKKFSDTPADDKSINKINASENTKNETNTSVKKTEDINIKHIKTEDIKTENIKTESIKTESIKTESIKTENNKTENNKTKNNKTKNNKTKNNKTKNVKTKANKSTNNHPTPTPKENGSQPVIKVLSKPEKNKIRRDRRKEQKKLLAEQEKIKNAAANLKLVQKEGEDKTTTEPGKEEERDIDITEDERILRTLFVGNVNTKAKPKDISKLFEPYSRLESLRIRNIIADNPNLPKKVAIVSNRINKFIDSYAAYVVFPDEEGIQDKMMKAKEALHLTEFMDKHIRVMPADIKLNRKLSRFSAFIGNIPHDCTEEEFIVTFSEVIKKIDTNLVNVRLNKDVDTGICRGTGYVSVSDNTAVQALINLTGSLYIRKNKLRIFRASKEENVLSKTHKRKKREESRKEMLLHKRAKREAKKFMKARQFHPDSKPHHDFKPPRSGLRT